MPKISGESLGVVGRCWELPQGRDSHSDKGPHVHAGHRGTLRTAAPRWLLDETSLDGS